MAQDNRKPLTLIEVAQRLGVSKSTVSAAFTGKGTITAARREAVMRAAIDLGYEPNPYAQRLVQGSRSDMICIYTPNMGAGAFSQVIEGLQSAIVERGISAPIHIAGRHRGEAEYQLSVLRGLRLQRPKAMVCSLRNLLPELRAELERYALSGGILIGADGYVSEDLGCDWVRFDRQRNAYLATKYLIDHGHTKIGMYTPSPSKLDRLSGDTPVLDGFSQAHREYGLAVRPDWLMQQSYYEDGGMWLAKAFLALDDRPTAMFVINDNAASAFVQQLYRAGVRVPEDVSVFGHDNAAPAASCMVPLTTISWPMQPMVSALEDMLFSRTSGEYMGLRREVVLHGELTVRDSVRQIGAP
ncbi:MAG TPA: LacI family DNA-binding transcriptional regulator [Capsulimonadaceae bacterium]